MINWRVNYNLKAKYGSKIAKYNGHELEVFCDRTGTKGKRLLSTYLIAACFASSCVL